MKIDYSLIGFDYAKATQVEEINRILTCLFATSAGSCAGDRNYGVDHGITDLPINVAENRLALEIMEKIETYEPRVKILDIATVPDGNSGSIKATVRIGPADDYDEEESDEDDEDEDEEDDEEDDE